MWYFIAEAVIEPKNRLTWPYGDLVPGGYIAKVSLPVFAVIMAIAVSKKIKLACFLVLLVYYHCFYFNW